MRRLKFGNKWTTCLSRHKHQSQFEASICNRLLSMKQNKQIKNYDIQRSFDLFGGTERAFICKHVVDFVVLLNTGTIEIWEAKGGPTKTASWQIKKKLFEACYPELIYKVIERR